MKSLHEAFSALDEGVERLLDRDDRFERELYHVVIAGLMYAGALGEQQGRDVYSVPELGRLVTVLVSNKYGPLGSAVLRDWGVHRPGDFVELLQRLGDEGLATVGDLAEHQDYDLLGNLAGSEG